MLQHKCSIPRKGQKDKWAIKTSAEFGNFLVRSCLKKVPEGEDVNIKGAIIATFPVAEKANFEIEKVKKFMGIQQAVVNTTVKPGDILILMDEFPRAFFALTIKTDKFDLKIKAKAPKSGKPGKKGDKEPKADFCSIKTNEKDIIDDLIFDFPGFSEISIKHTIKITNIEIPEGEEDPIKIRENSKREGTIERIITSDKGNFIEEKEFKA